ncbi:MAG: ABC transporter ATP-binding protein, partial [Eubacterium sp.]
DPTMCLDPTMKIGHQLTEAIQIHRKLSKQEAKAEAIKLMEMVQIPEAEKRLNHYPYQFSGGMCQRVMIAIALACHPKLLIADEPTTALDVTIQRQIINLIKDLKKRLGMSVMLITHDLSIVAGLADRVAVMYAGKIVEEGRLENMFYHFKHPYTEALLKSLPSMETDPKAELESIPGMPPDLLLPIEGCAFAPRCHKKMRICLKSAPPDFEIEEKHRVACWCQHPDFKEPEKEAENE